MTTNNTLEPRQAAAPAKPATVRTLLESRKGDIQAALAAGIKPDYFTRVVLTAVQRNPKLAECTPLSFLGAVLQCAQLGLVPDGFMGQAYLIPYKGQAQFQIGYRGMIELARRSGDVRIVHAEVVYQKDKFRQRFGLDMSVEHEKYEGTDEPGPLTHVYAFYKLRDNSYDLVVMNRREVEAIKKRSQAVRSNKTDSPWFTDEAAMWKKTAIKQLLKTAPMAIEVRQAVAYDDMAERGIPQDMHILADPTAEATPLLPEGDDDDAPVVPTPQPPATNGGDAAATPGGGSGAPATPRVATASPSPTPAVTITAWTSTPSTKNRARDGFWWFGTLADGTRVHTYTKAIAEQCGEGVTLRMKLDTPDAQGLREILAVEPQA